MAAVAAALAARVFPTIPRSRIVARRGHGEMTHAWRSDGLTRPATDWQWHGRHGKGCCRGLALRAAIPGNRRSGWVPGPATGWRWHGRHGRRRRRWQPLRAEIPRNRLAFEQTRPATG